MISNHSWLNMKVYESDMVDIWLIYRYGSYTGCEHAARRLICLRTAAVQRNVEQSGDEKGAAHRAVGIVVVHRLWETFVINKCADYGRLHLLSLVHLFVSRESAIQNQ